MPRVLIIDDQPQIRGFLSAMLVREGYEVLEAPDGKEALRVFHENPADLIITDLIMPEKEGLELIRELRADFPDLKIIAMSGGGRIAPQDYLALAKFLGAHRVFAKPFEPHELLQAVAELLGPNEKTE